MRVAGAVDIGGTRTKIGVVAEDGCILERDIVSTPARGDPKPLVDGIAVRLAAVFARAAKDVQVAGIGVSVAGFLDRDRACMFGNANLPSLCGFPLRRALEQRLGRPCVLEVDSNAAVLAEYRYGGGRDSKRLLGVTVGTGLGGGVMLDGLLLRHTGECAGDLGHVLVAEGGRRCTCGENGCLEAMVSSAALSERAAGKPVREITRAAQAGSPRALEAIAETARWLGVGLASLAPLFAPDTIVVGGGVAAAGDLLLDGVRTSFRAHAGDEFRDSVRIVGSSLEGWGGLVGAASIVFAPQT